MQEAERHVLPRYLDIVLLICRTAGPLLRVTIVFYKPTEHKKIKFAVLIRVKSEGYKQIILTVELYRNDTLLSNLILPDF